MSLADLPVLEYEERHWDIVDAFWGRILGRHWNERARERWRWLSARRTHFLIRDDDRLLGNATLLKQPFVTRDDSPVDLGWITDFYVSPELKGLGMGKRLTHRLMQEVDVAATFGQSQEARWCFSSLQWSGPEWIPLVGRSFPGAAKPRDHVFRRAAPDDPVVDALWTARAALPGLTGLRDASALSQRLKGRPDAVYELWIAERDRSPVGWVVLRMIRELGNRRFGPVPTGLVVDAFCPGGHEESYRALIALSLRRFREKGIALAMAAWTQGPLGEALQREGFRSSLHVLGAPLMALPVKGLMAHSDSVPQPCRFPHLTFLDCDAELTF